MADDTFVTQTVTEIVKQSSGGLRTTQVVVEYARVLTSNLRVSQTVVEIVLKPLSTTDMSGIYFVNPKSFPRHDIYYGRVRKVPNPTIRTALIGD